MCAKQGGKLDGNSTRKLLKCLDSLEFELQQCAGDAYLRGLPFIQALRDFSQVVHMCFGQLLVEGWQQAIAKFTTSYSSLVSKSGKPISITPKVHIVMEHVKQFLEMKGVEKGKRSFISLKRFIYYFRTWLLV